MDRGRERYKTKPGESVKIKANEYRNKIATLILLAARGGTVG